MKEDRRYDDNAFTLKPLLSKVKRITKKTAQSASMVQQEWERVLPPARLRFTRIIEFRANMLVIAVSNSSLRSELEMGKQHLIDDLNAGSKIFVRELVFRIG